MNYIVTIDGPSGVGKTSLGSLLAQEYNSNFFSSGKLYRIIAKYFIEHSTSDTSSLQIEINEELQITLNSYSYADSDLYIKNIKIVTLMLILICILKISILKVLKLQK